jgi:DNA polymerase III epsilon subunit-like protein
VISTSLLELVAFDLETTGVDPFTDVPVSYTLGDITEYVNPERPIPEGASAIHGITNDMVKGASNQTEITFLLYHYLQDYWKAGKIIIGMNVSYDLTMVNSMCLKLGFGLDVGPVLDVLVIDRHYDTYRKGSRTLTSLCEHYGVTLDNAHSSEADANACITIFEKQVEKWPQLRNINLENNVTMRKWHKEWLSNYSSYRVKNGDSPINSGRYYWPIQRNI